MVLLLVYVFLDYTGFVTGPPFIFLLGCMPFHIVKQCCLVTKPFIMICNVAINKANHSGTM